MSVSIVDKETIEFSGANPPRVSFVAMVNGNGRTSPEAALALVEKAPVSAALDKAKGDFAAIAEERNTAPAEGASVSDRLAKMRASIGKSRATSDTLAKNALGIETPQKEAALSDEAMIARAAALATAKYGAPTQTAETSAPAPQFVPVPEKGPKQLS